MLSINLFSSLFVLTLCFLVTIYQSSRVDRESYYLLNNRKTGFFSLTATLVMTELNPATLLSFSSFGYLVGLWALWMPFIFLFGIGFYGFAVAKKWKEFDRMSVAEFFKARYSSKFGKAVAICLLVAMAGFCATYIKSMSVVFHALFPHLSTSFIGLVFCFLILVMTLRGGLSSIIRLDVFSFILTALFFCFAAFFSWKSVQFAAPSTINEVLPLVSARKMLPLLLIASLVLLCMFTYILAPWYGQKIFSAKSPTIAKLAAMSSSIIVFGIYSLSILICVFVRLQGIELSNIEQALPVSFTALLPIGFAGVGFALFFLAGATTLAGVWSAMVSMVIADFVKKEKERSKNLSILLTILVACLTLLFAITFVDRVFDQLILSNIPVFALSFALIGGFYFKQVNTVSAAISVFVGLFWGVFSYLFWGENHYTPYWVFVGLVLIFLSGIIATKVTSKSYQLQ